MRWLRLVGSLKLQVSCAEYSLFYRPLLQNRPIISGSQFIPATSYSTIPLTCHETCTCVTWPIHECDMTHPRVTPSCVTHVWVTHVWVTQLCVTYSCVGHSCVAHLFATRLRATPMGWLRCVGALKIGLFCKRALPKRRYSAKETYNSKEPTNRSQPMVEGNPIVQSLDLPRTMDVCHMTHPCLTHVCVTHSCVTHACVTHVCVTHLCVTYSCATHTWVAQLRMYLYHTHV